MKEHVVSELDHKIWTDVTAPENGRWSHWKTSSAWMFVSSLFDLQQPLDSPACFLSNGLDPPPLLPPSSLNISSSGAFHCDISENVDVSVIVFVNQPFVSLLYLYPEVNSQELINLQTSWESHVQENTSNIQFLTVFPAHSLELTSPLDHFQVTVAAGSITLVFLSLSLSVDSSTGLASGRLQHTGWRQRPDLCFSLMDIKETSWCIRLLTQFGCWEWRREGASGAAPLAGLWNGIYCFRKYSDPISL